MCAQPRFVMHCIANNAQTDGLQCVVFNMLQNKGVQTGQYIGCCPSGTPVQHSVLQKSSSLQSRGGLRLLDMSAWTSVSQILSQISSNEMMHCKLFHFLSQNLDEVRQSVFAHSASAVTLSKQVQLTLIGSPLRALQ